MRTRRDTLVHSEEKDAANKKLAININEHKMENQNTSEQNDEHGWLFVACFYRGIKTHSKSSPVVE